MKEIPCSNTQWWKWSQKMKMMIMWWENTATQECIFYFFKFKKITQRNVMFKKNIINNLKNIQRENEWMNELLAPFFLLPFQIYVYPFYCVMMKYFNFTVKNCTVLVSFTLSFCFCPCHFVDFSQRLCSFRLSSLVF